MDDRVLRSMYEAEVVENVSRLNVELFASFTRKFSDGTYENANDEAAYQSWKEANGYS